MPDPAMPDLPAVPTGDGVLDGQVTAYRAGLLDQAGTALLRAALYARAGTAQPAGTVITELTGVQLATAMLTLRLAGHGPAANVFQTELTRRAAALRPARDSR